ncbi:MAG TPA: hypothetical protein DCO79_12960 [Spirochaeta sp.]|nr:hypothetical protein [Spirochaeta sp.]
MLLIRRSITLILFVLTAASVIIIASSAYSFLTAAGGMSDDALRFQAERVLFIGIILACLLSAAFTLVILRSRNIRKELDRLIGQNRLNPAATRDGLLRLGETGRKLNELYRQIDEVSVMRGLKISALSKTAEYLCQNIEDALLIVDVTGRVIQASRAYLETEGLSRSELVDSQLPLLSNGLQMSSILSRLEKKHLPVETEVKGGSIRWVPIFNSENEISYIAVHQSADSPN